jgi:hypothetical protein
MTRGIIIAVPEKYQQICLNNLLNMRLKMGLNLPIEIWQIGEEISSNYLESYKRLPNVVVKNVMDYSTNPQHWKGFQVKAFILYHTEFSEPILCDADVIFHQDPDIIFDDPHYIETGTYFFRDIEYWKFENLQSSNNKFNSIEFFTMRKDFVRSLIPEKSDLFPREWSYIYDKTPPSSPVLEAYMEAGCVYINKERHQDVINRIYYLNFNHEHTYQFIWGDKETYWLACIMNNKKYYINPPYGFINENQKLCQNYNDKLFYTQK